MNRLRFIVENFLAPENTKYMRFQPPAVENRDLSRLEEHQVAADLATKLALAGTVELHTVAAEPQL